MDTNGNIKQLVHILVDHVPQTAPNAMLPAVRCVVEKWGGQLTKTNWMLTLQVDATSVAILAVVDVYENRLPRQ